MSTSSGEQDAAAAAARRSGPSLDGGVREAHAALMGALAGRHGREEQARAIADLKSLKTDHRSQHLRRLLAEYQELGSVMSTRAEEGC